MEENISDLQFIAGHEAYALIFRPDMRKPAHAFPVREMFPVLFVENIDKLDIRIGVTGRDRRRQDAHHIIGAPSALSSNQTD